MLFVERRHSDGSYKVIDTMDKLTKSAETYDIRNYTEEELRECLENGVSITGASLKDGELVVKPYELEEHIVSQYYIRNIALGKSVTFAKEGYAYVVKQMFYSDISLHFGLQPTIFCIPEVTFTNRYGVRTDMTVHYNQLPKILPDWCDGVYVDTTNAFGCVVPREGIEATVKGVLPYQSGTISVSDVMSILDRGQEIRFPDNSRILCRCISVQPTGVVKLLDRCRVVVPDSVEVMKHTFNGIDFMKGSKILSKNLKILSDRAFAHCDFRELGDVILPDGVKAVGKACFRGCFHSESVIRNLPRSLEFIGDAAFSREDIAGLEHVEGKLFEIVIPEQVKYVGKNAFAAVRCDCFTLLMEDEITLTLNCFRVQWAKLRVKRGLVIHYHETMRQIDWVVGEQEEYAKMIMELIGVREVEII